MITRLLGKSKSWDPKKVYTYVKGRGNTDLKEVWFKYTFTWIGFYQGLIVSYPTLIIRCCFLAKSWSCRVFHRFVKAMSPLKEMVESIISPWYDIRTLANGESLYVWYFSVRHFVCWFEIQSWSPTHFTISIYQPPTCKVNLWYSTWLFSVILRYLNRFRLKEMWLVVNVCLKIQFSQLSLNTNSKTSHQPKWKSSIFSIKHRIWL